jgi:hypothetical protein
MHDDYFLGDLSISSSLRVALRPIAPLPTALLPIPSGAVIQGARIEAVSAILACTVTRR